MFLPGAREVRDQLPESYDYLIVVDCSDNRRVGTVLEGGIKVDLVVDHHKSHIDFGEIDYVEAENEATALMLVENCRTGGLRSQWMWRPV